MVKVLALLIINLCSILNSPFSALATILDGGNSFFSRSLSFSGCYINPLKNIPKYFTQLDFNLFSLCIAFGPAK